jgi:N-acetylneuraminic acid mutarotase
MTPTQGGTVADQPLATSYVLASNTWTTKAPLPEEELYRHDLAAAVVNNANGQSIVYVLGGAYGNVNYPNPATSILAYDVATNTWTRKSARFTGAASNGIGKVGNKLYISGGTDFFNMRQTSPRLYAYDLTGDRVIRKADMPIGTSEGMTGVINGKLYVLATVCGTVNGGASCRKFFRYDPATNKWTSLPPPPNDHWRGAAAVLNGKFYVAGGSQFRPHRAFDVYDPVTNSWTSLGLMPPRRPVAQGVALDGRFYVVGIQATDRNTVAYYPPTNTWRNKAPFPQGETGQLISGPQAAVRVMLEGSPRIFTVGSEIYSDPPATVTLAPSFLYTP